MQHGVACRCVARGLCPLARRSRRLASRRAVFPPLCQQTRANWPLEPGGRQDVLFFCFFCHIFPPFEESSVTRRWGGGPGAAKRVRACVGMGILLSKIFGKLIGQKEVLGCPCRARLLTSLHAAGSALATGRGPGVAAAGHRSRCCPWPERASHRQQRLMLALVAVHSVLARCGF